MSSTQSSQIVLHHLNKSRSERLFWVLEELGLPYEVKVWMRTPVMAPKELRAIHPLGKAPIITDHGKAIAESGTIIDYLIHTYPSQGADTSFNLQSNYFSHYSEGVLMLFMQQITTFDASANMAPWYIKPVISGFVGQIKSAYLLKEVQKNVDFLEDELKKTPHGWFGGGESPSAGDYMLLFPVHSLLNADKFSNIKFGSELKKWMERVEARPAYQRGMARLREEEAKAKAESS